MAGASEHAQSGGEVNRAAKRSPLVVDGGAPHCPVCRGHLEFRTDRHGRALEQCECGYRAYVARRTGKREEVAVVIAPAP